MFSLNVDTFRSPIQILTLLDVLINSQFFNIVWALDLVDYVRMIEWDLQSLFGSFGVIFWVGVRFKNFF